jgi:hypothetical protein
MKEIILGLSYAAVGLSVYLVRIHALAFLRQRELDSAGLVQLLVGVSGITGLIAWLIFGSGPIPPTWRAIAYAVFLLLIVTGVITLAIAHRRSKRKNHLDIGKETP